jgi:hypothetical protein
MYKTISQDVEHSVQLWGDLPFFKLWFRKEKIVIYLGKYGSVVRESWSASLVGEAFEVKKIFRFSRLLMKGNEIEFCKLHL